MTRRLVRAAAVVAIAGLALVAGASDPHRIGGRGRGNDVLPASLGTLVMLGMLSVLHDRRLRASGSPVLRLDTNDA